MVGSSSSSFSGMMTSADLLPDDLLLEILYRLPAWSAVQCKSVCKRWFSLISSPAFIPSFIARNNHQSPQDHPLILKSWESCLFLTPKLPNISFSFVPKNSENYAVNILASSGFDMILCSILNKLDRTYKYFICNLFTKHYVQIPDPPPRAAVRWPNLTCYGLITYRPAHCVDSSTTVEFKIFCRHFPPKRDFGLEFDTFSSQTWQWTKAIVNFPMDCFLFCPCSAIPRNGLLYWVTADGEVIIHDPCTREVSYFVKPPEDAKCPIPCTYSVCCGSLLMHKLRKDWKLRIYELVEDCGDGPPKWRLDRAVTLTEHLKKLKLVQVAVDLDVAKAVQVMGLHPDDRDILYLRSQVQGVGTLNLRTGTFKPQPLISAPFSNIQENISRNSSCLKYAQRLIVIKAPCWPSQMPPAPLAMLDGDQRVMNENVIAIPPSLHPRAAVPAEGAQQHPLATGYKGKVSNSTKLTNKFSPAKSRGLLGMLSCCCRKQTRRRARKDQNEEEST